MIARDTKSSRFLLKVTPSSNESVSGKLGQVDGNLVNILRGRVTDKEAQFEVELSGTPLQINDTLARMRENGVQVRQLP